MRSKKQLRAAYRESRQQLSVKEIEEASISIANRIINLDVWKHSNYHIFLPITALHEINTTYLLQVLQGRDKNVILSRSNFTDFTLLHYLLTDQTRIVINSHGIPEPELDSIEFNIDLIDVVFVPLLCADLSGNRLGYGKGFYDKFLASCRDDVIKIGLCYFPPISSIPEIATHDVVMDLLVTPDQVFQFN
ncbi:MAG: 5-formyltetrahydrofolate cyclo-ligase [Nonlabens sp.]